MVFVVDFVHCLIIPPPSICSNIAYNALLLLSPLSPVNPRFTSLVVIFTLIYPQFFTLLSRNPWQPSGDLFIFCRPESLEDDLPMISSSVRTLTNHRYTTNSPNGTSCLLDRNAQWSWVHTHNPPAKESCPRGHVVFTIG